MAVGDVGVEDRDHGLVEADVDSLSRRYTQLELFANSLVDDDVGVDGHADGERDSRDARQRQGRAEQRQGRQHEQHVDGQRDIGQKPARAVPQSHEDQHDGEAHHGRNGALSDAVGPEGGPDLTDRGHDHRGVEGSGAQDQRQGLSLFQRIGGPAHVDAGRATADSLTNGGRAHDLLVEHDGEPLADVGGGDGAEHLTAAGLELERHESGLVLVPGDARIVHVVAGEHHVVLQRHRQVALLVTVGRWLVLPQQDAVVVEAVGLPQPQVEQLIIGELVGGHLVLGRLHDLVEERVVELLVDHAELEHRRGADGVDRRLDIDHSGELHVDTAAALLDDARLFDAGGVDPLTEGLEDLLDRLVFDLLLTLGGHLERVRLAVGLGVDVVVESLAHERLQLGQRRVGRDVDHRLGV